MRVARPEGAYAKARRGAIPELTGISDPHEPPSHLEMRIHTSQLSPMEAAQEIYLFLPPDGDLEVT